MTLVKKLKIESAGDVFPETLSFSDRLGFLVKDTAMFGVMNAFGKSISFLTFPIVARSMSISEYGSFDLALSIIGILTVLMAFGQDSAVARFFYDNDNNYSRQIVISTSLIFQICVLLACLPALWLALNFVMSEKYLGDDFFRINTLIILLFPLHLIINFSCNILKWSFSRRPYFIINLGFALSQGGVIIFLWSVSALSPFSIFLLSLLPSIFFATLGIFCIRNWLVLPKSINKLKPLLSYAWPIGITSLLLVATPMVERILVVQWLGLEAFGKYAAAMKICVIITLIQAAFQTSWGPFALSIFKQDDSHITYNHVAKFVTGLFCLIALFMSLISETLIVFIAGERYAEVSFLVGPICLASVVVTVGMILEIGISIAKKPIITMFSSLLGIIVTLTISTILIPNLGVLGVTMSVLIGLIVKTISSVTFAQKVHYINWAFFPIIRYTFSTIAGVILNLYFLHSGLLMLSKLSIILVSFPLFLFLLRDLKSSRLQIS